MAGENLCEVRHAVAVAVLVRDRFQARGDVDLLAGLAQLRLDRLEAGAERIMRLLGWQILLCHAGRIRHMTGAAIIQSGRQERTEVICEGALVLRPGPGWSGGNQHAKQRQAQCSPRSSLHETLPEIDASTEAGNGAKRWDNPNLAAYRRDVNQNQERREADSGKAEPAGVMRRRGRQKRNLN